LEFITMIRLSVLVLVVLLGYCQSRQALHARDTIADWLCAGEDERAVVADTLSVIAGQGLPDRDEKFFTDCVADVASNSRAYDRRIGDVAAGCMLTAQAVLLEQE